MVISAGSRTKMKFRYLRQAARTITLLVDFVAPDDLNCQGRSTIKVGIFQVDSREFPEIKNLRLAGRVRSVFGRRFAKGKDGQIYSSLGRTPQTDQLRRRVKEVSLHPWNQRGFQPSLTGLVHLPSLPRTASWAKFSRPFGTGSARSVPKGRLRSVATGLEAHLILLREGVRVVEAAARNIRAISFDVERCIDSSGAPKGGRACCYLGVCLCHRTPAMAKRC